jgi:hypothetical protein
MLKPVVSTLKDAVPLNKKYKRQNSNARAGD